MTKKVTTKHRGRRHQQAALPRLPAAVLRGGEGRRLGWDEAAQAFASCLSYRRLLRIEKYPSRGGFRLSASAAVRSLTPVVAA